MGFNSGEIKNKFISHFEDSYFTTLEDRINEIINMLELSRENEGVYSEMIRSYPAVG
jgi:hypothetical protein